MGSPKSRKPPPRVALPRYREEHWERWLETVSDRDLFVAGFTEWQRSAEAMAERIRRSGFEVVWIDLDPKVIDSWCRSRGYSNTSEKRFQWAAEQIGNVRIH